MENKIENIAADLAGVKNLLEIIGEQSGSYTGLALFVTADLVGNCSKKLYEIFDELRGGGKWGNSQKKCGACAYERKNIVVSILQTQ